MFLKFNTHKIEFKTVFNNRMTDTMIWLANG